MVYDYFQYIVDLVVIFKYGRETGPEYFKQYESFDTIVNFTYYKKVRSRIIKVVSTLLVIFLLSSTLDFITWYLTYSFMITVVYSIAYIFLLIKVLTNLDLTSQVINVEYRLRVIGDWVQDCYQRCDRRFPEFHAKNNGFDPVLSKNWFYFDRRPTRFYKTCTTRGISSNHCHELKLLSWGYLLLNEQCTFVGNFYGYRVLLQTLSLLIDMVRYLNMGVRLSVGSQSTPYSVGYFPVVSCIIRFAFCGVMMTSLVFHCEKAYRKVERIRSLCDHILVNKNPDAVLRTSITELRDLVSARPIPFKMANLFRLCFSFLISTVSVAVTYTIILLQGI